MAEAGISVDQFSVDQFSCPVCLDLLRDPVTTPCGHSFCKVCINHCWDQEDQRGIYICPQCRKTFTPRPEICRNTVLAEVVEKLKKAELQAASPAHWYAGPGDIKCDYCTGRKLKAIKSCLTCLASFCETHLKSHYEIPGLKKHTLVEACGELQEKICSQHDKVIEIYCRTDQSFICYLCTMDQHKGHRTVPVKNERTEKQSWPSLCVASRYKDSARITVNQHLSFDGVTKSLSNLKKPLEEFCKDEFNRISLHAAAVEMILPSEPKSRKDFLQYFYQLTLDPNTAHRNLILSKKNKVVTFIDRAQPYFDHPERFDLFKQVLCEESVSGRCYWEVEWSGGAVVICVSYKEISRKGEGRECGFGYNNQSWILWCSSSSIRFYHNNIRTDLEGPSSSRIGVFVDHSAGTLSFYSISDTMRLLHRVQTTFTQPLYAGIGIGLFSYGSVRLCDPK